MGGKRTKGRVSFRLRGGSMQREFVGKLDAAAVFVLYHSESWEFRTSKWFLLLICRYSFSGTSARLASLFPSLHTCDMRACYLLCEPVTQSVGLSEYSRLMWVLWSEGNYSAE